MFRVLLALVPAIAACSSPELVDCGEGGKLVQGFCIYRGTERDAVDCPASLPVRRVYEDAIVCSRDTAAPPRPVCDEVPSICALDASVDASDDAIPDATLACSASADCSPNQTCVDGFCCKTECDEPCWACDLPGQEGTCTPLPVGAPDPACGAFDCTDYLGFDADGTCSRSNVHVAASERSCDGSGGCDARSCLEDTADLLPVCDPSLCTPPLAGTCEGNRAPDCGMGSEAIVRFDVVARGACDAELVRVADEQSAGLGDGAEPFDVGGYMVSGCLDLVPMASWTDAAITLRPAVEVCPTSTASAGPANFVFRIGSDEASLQQIDTTMTLHKTSDASAQTISICREAASPSAALAIDAVVLRGPCP